MASGLRRVCSIAAPRLPVLLAFSCFSAVPPLAAQHPRGAPEQMARVAGLVGEWNVQLEMRNAPNEPFTTLRTTSTITQLLKGAFVQERIVLPTPAGQSIELVGIFGYDRFRSVYRFAWLDDHFALFDVMEGNWHGDSLVVNNLRSRTTIPAGGKDMYSRMVWRPLGTDSVLVESLVSADSGATWFTQTRARYLRR